MSRLIKKRKEKIDLSLRSFHEKRNSIVIYRANGGLGDILVHRMIFEDFKRLMPDAKVVFACPQIYHQVVADHPYIDELVDSATVDLNDYLISYNTTNACCRYEVRMAPFSGKNRSDIWANHCGVDLQSHNMHIKLEDSLIEETKKEIQAKRNGDGPAVLFTPISAMVTKNLLHDQVEGVVWGLRERGFFVYSSHTHPLPILQKLEVPTLIGSTRQWMGYVNAADYVISVDTAAFHMAGGISKPCVGIFSVVDGKVYGRWYKNWVLVQKHRDNGDWDCGPCYNWPDCKKCKQLPKPCLTELSVDMILRGFDELVDKHPPQTHAPH
jgi:ADP-heptose:LPS heptosyltransferase